jgi:SAM-dependent methyltransferase
MNAEMAFMYRAFPSPPPLDWYETYALPAGWDGVKGRLPGLSILDVACGNGWVAYHARKAGAQVLASDIFTTGVDRSIPFVLASKMELPFPDAAFDAVLTSNSLHHGTLVKSCQEAYRVLRPGGFFVSFIEPCIWNHHDEMVYLNTICAAELASGIAERRPNRLTISTNPNALAYAFRLNRGIRWEARRHEYTEPQPLDPAIIGAYAPWEG